MTIARHQPGAHARSDSSPHRRPGTRSALSGTRAVTRQASPAVTGAPAGGRWARRSCRAGWLSAGHGNGASAGAGGGRAGPARWTKQGQGGDASGDGTGSSGGCYPFFFGGRPTHRVMSASDRGRAAGLRSIPNLSRAVRAAVPRAADRAPGLRRGRRVPAGQPGVPPAPGWRTDPDLQRARGSAPDRSGVAPAVQRAFAGEVVALRARASTSARAPGGGDPGSSITLLPVRAPSGGADPRRLHLPRRDRGGGRARGRARPARPPAAGPRQHRRGRPGRRSRRPHAPGQPGRDPAHRGQRR